MRNLFFLPVLFWVSCGMGSAHKLPSKLAEPQLVVVATAQDSILFNEMLQWWKVQPHKNSSWRETIPAVANFWLGTPYVANTLEIEGEEQLVVNLREMDCTTYVEYVVALSYTLNCDKPIWDEFVRDLASIRYRNGEVEGYNSRLHYFTEWLQNKVQRGKLILISDSIGNAAFDTNVNFMSHHPHYYWQLVNDSSLVDSISHTEREISKYQMGQITKDKIQEVESFIEDGDIIALVSTVDGLDVSHVGFAQFVGTRLHFLHASTTSNQVELTKLPLSDYLRARSTVTGVLVGRMK